MKRNDLRYILVSVFIGCTSVFYCCTRWFHITLPRYYPLEHAWKWVSEPGKPSQAWFGIQAFAFLAAGLVTVVVYGLCKWRAREGVHLGPTATRVLALATTGLVVMAMSYIVCHEYGKWGVFEVLGL